MGLTVESRTTLDHYLFWDTRHTFGEEETDETDFDFASFRRREQSNANTGVDLYTELAMGFSFSSSGRQGIDDQPAPGLIGAYNALYLETPNGETRSMVITLSDYYAYYPITGTIRLPSCTLRLSWEDAHQTVQPDKNQAEYVAWRLQEYFKIPVLEGQQMEISIRKSASGNSVGAGGSTLGPDSYSASTQSVLTADACYFTLNALTAQGKVIDVSQIEGGFGLYRLPCGSQPFNIDALEMVYPLNPTASVWHMAVNAAETQLLLFTDEGGPGVADGNRSGLHD